MMYTDTNGKVHRGASAVQAGHYGNSDKGRAEVQKGSSSNKDIFSLCRME